MNEKEEQRIENMLLYEKELYIKGFKKIAGIDEAGRGPLAGPVVAACVVMPQDKPIAGINDSKKIAENKREKLFEEIVENAICYGLGIVWQEEIDEINILNASKRAFYLAYENMAVPCDYVLIDGRDVIELECRTEAIISGDAKCYSIAAASILAKVTRDRLMREYDKEYPIYGFAQNKGYGTKEHTDALKNYGFCVLHRKTFIKNFF